MALFSFYNTRRPRQFNHQPIYWDPKKEEMEKRVQRIKREIGMAVLDEEYKPDIKGKFVQGTTHLRRRMEKGETSRGRTYKNVKLIVALVVLIFILWYLFFK